MAIAELAAAPYNPRRISEPAPAGLSASIARFGLVQPIVFNERTGRVVGGQQRLKVLRAQGEDQVDVMVVDLPESEEKALNVVLNSGAISGEFVQEDLDRLLEELKACEPELFDQLLLEELASQALREALGATEGLTDEDTVPEPPEDPISVRGTVYQLLAGERIQLVNTDPPCNEKVEPRSNNASPLMAQARCSASAGAPRGRGGNVAR